MENPKHLKKHKTPEIDKDTKLEAENVTNQKEKVPTAKTKEEEVQKEFDLRLADLKSAVSEMEKHNKDSVGGPKEEITEEIFENIMKMPVSEFMEYANGGKNINKPDLRSVHDQVSGIINGEFNEEYKGSKFRQVMNMPVTKVFFAAFCLFLKFGVSAQAHEVTVKDNTDSGHKIETNFDGGGNTPHLDRENANDTYKLSPDDAALKNLKEVSTLDILQSFETDKADVSKADSLDITNKIHTFLDKINTHNIKDFKEAKKVVEVSSDERATKFGAEDKKAEPTLEGNTLLSKARAEKAAGIAESAFKTHDYSKSGLDTKDIKETQNTKVETKIPDKGYTKITELNKINPETGKVYTEKDVENMKTSTNADVKALYNDLLKECRYAKINLMVESEKESLKKVDQFDRFFLYVDKSPSSKYSMNNMAKTLTDMGLKENSKGNITKVDLVYYSDNVDKVKASKNIQEAAKDLRLEPTDGAGHAENPFASCIKHLEKVVQENAQKIKNGEKIEKENNGLAISLTEGLQDSKNLFKAIKLMRQAGVDVDGGKATILMYSPKSDKPLEIKLIDLENKIEKVIKARMEASIPAYQEKINQSEKNLQVSLDKVVKNVSPKLLKELLKLDKVSDLGDENNIKEKLMGSFKFDDEYKWAHNKNEAYNTIKQLTYAKASLAETEKYLKQAKNETVEGYLASHNIQIKTFTDEKGNKANFEIYDGEDRFTGPGYVAPRAEYISL